MVGKGAFAATIVRVDASSRAAVESFLAEATGFEVALGEVRLVAGRLGALVAGLSRAAGVTFGGCVFVSRDVGARVRARVDERGRLVPGGALDALGSLLVHECVHVWQYRREGTTRFLIAYLYSYFTSLLGLRSVGVTARRAAYLGIPFEREAYALEAVWRASPRPPCPASTPR